MFPDFGYYQQSCFEQSHTDFCVDICFHFSGVKLLGHMVSGCQVVCKVALLFAFSSVVHESSCSSIFLPTLQPKTPAPKTQAVVKTMNSRGGQQRQGLVGLFISVRILGYQSNKNLQGCQALCCHCTDGKTEAQKGKGPILLPEGFGVGGGGRRQWSGVGLRAGISELD